MTDKCVSGKDDHEFVDRYDRKETLPDSQTVDFITKQCHRYNISSDNICKMIEASKAATSTYVLSFCKHCGLTINRIISTE